MFHDGEQTFTNTSPWGDAFDQEYVKQSLIPETGPHGFEFPYDVGGWLSYEEGTTLGELATGKRVLEIGSYQGRSTVCLAQMAKEVVAIDPHTGEATGRPMDTLATLKANLRKHNLDNVEIVVSTTAEVVDEDLLGQFDLVFIDGAHDRQSVQYDLEFALRRLAPGGLLAFHDYRKFPGEFDGRWDPGVSETVDEFLATGAKLISTHATLAVVKPPADILMEA